jgi:hypothetical protein
MCLHIIICSKYIKLLNSSATSTVLHIAPPHAVQTCFGAHATSSLVMSTLSPKVNRPEHKVDHSSPSSADVKNEHSYSNSPICDRMVHIGKTLLSFYKYKV